MRNFGFLFFLLIIGDVLLLKPYQTVLTFTETRTEQPAKYILSLQDNKKFQIKYTHSIHLTDVVESYEALPTGELQLLGMEYSDVAIGMPATAEEGQTLTYENGKYVLKYDMAFLPNFTLYIGDVDYDLRLLHDGIAYDLKTNLKRGKSYMLQIEKLSIYEKLKGVELYGQ